MHRVLKLILMRKWLLPLWKEKRPKNVAIFFACLDSNTPPTKRFFDNWLNTVWGKKTWYIHFILPNDTERPLSYLDDKQCKLFWSIANAWFMTKMHTIKCLYALSTNNATHPSVFKQLWWDIEPIVLIESFKYCYMILHHNKRITMWRKTIPTTIERQTWQMMTCQGVHMDQWRTPSKEDRLLHHHHWWHEPT